MNPSRIDPNGLYRIRSIVRIPPKGKDRGKGRDKDQGDVSPPLIDVSAATWWAGVRSGRFPAPIRLGQRLTCWRGSDLLAYVESLFNGAS